MMTIEIYAWCFRWEIADESALTQSLKPIETKTDHVLLI